MTDERFNEMSSDLLLTWQDRGWASAEELAGPLGARLAEMNARLQDLITLVEDLTDSVERYQPGEEVLVDQLKNFADRFETWKVENNEQ